MYSNAWYYIPTGSRVIHRQEDGEAVWRLYPGADAEQVWYRLEQDIIAGDHMGRSYFFNGVDFRYDAFESFFSDILQYTNTGARCTETPAYSPPELPAIGERRRMRIRR